MADSPLPWLLLTDAAAHLGLSIRTLQRRIVAGGLPSRKDGRGRVEVQIPVDALPPEVAATHALQTHAAAHEQTAIALTAIVESMRASHREAVQDIRADARLQVRSWQLVASVAVVAAVVLGVVSIRNESAGVTSGQSSDIRYATTPNALERGGQVVVVDDDWQGVPFR